MWGNFVARRTKWKPTKMPKILIKLVIYTYNELVISRKYPLKMVIGDSGG